MIDLRETIKAKSDQLNADDLMGGPITITISRLEAGPIDQPLFIHADNLQGRPYKPSKAMRRVLSAMWGMGDNYDGAHWVGRSLVLYRDASVVWAGKAVGGVRISHATHIEKPIEFMIAISRGKKEAHKVFPLVVQSAFEQHRDNLTEQIKAGGSKEEWINFLNSHAPLTSDELAYINNL